MWKLLWPLWLEVHKYFKIRVSAIALSFPLVSPPGWPLYNAVAVLDVYSTVNHCVSSLFCNWRFYPTAHRKLVCPFVYGSATVILSCDVTSLLELTIAVALTLHVTVTLSCCGLSMDSDYIEINLGLLVWVRWLSMTELCMIVTSCDSEPVWLWTDVSVASVHFGSLSLLVLKVHKLLSLNAS